MDMVSDSDDGDEFEWDNDGNDGEAGSSDGDEFEWDSEGDGETRSLSAAGSSVQTSRNLHAPCLSMLARLDSNGERNNGVAPSVCMVEYFVGMGFSRETVLKAMLENGDRGEDSLLDLLFTYKVLYHTSDDNDDDILENWDDDNAANNSKDHLSNDDSGDEYMPSVASKAWYFYLSRATPVAETWICTLKIVIKSNAL